MTWNTGGSLYGKLLSTPHGALGTKIGKVSWCNIYNLSTPHGALGTIAKLELDGGFIFVFQLHTVH
jgi:hypothetical protein